MDTNVYIDINSSWLEDVSFTISYQPETESWISYHDYIPDFAFHLRHNKLLSFNNKGLYIHNQNNRCVFYNNTLYESYITPVFNPYLKEREERVYPFILNYLEWDTDVYDNERRRRDLTWTNISLHNSLQSTIKIPLVPYNSTCSKVSQFGIYNVDRVTNHWNFSKFRDNIIQRNLKSLDEQIDDEVEINVQNTNCTGVLKPRFRDDFVIVKLGYSNASQYLLCFNELLFNYTPLAQ